jgi:hypothetical protein
LPEVRRGLVMEWVRVRVMVRIRVRVRIRVMVSSKQHAGG